MSSIYIYIARISKRDKKFYRDKFDDERKIDKVKLACVFQNVYAQTQNPSSFVCVCVFFTLLRSKKEKRAVEKKNCSLEIV